MSQATNANASTFIYPTSHGNLTYALKAANTGDLYMHLQAPATYQWIGVGTGSGMDGSVMFIVYEGADKDSECSHYLQDPIESRSPHYRRDFVATALRRP